VFLSTCQEILVSPFDRIHGRTPIKKAKEREIIRFFMIGTGAAGKTTVVRQLKCLCKERPKNYKVYDEEWNQIAIENIFPVEEMAQFLKIIRINITVAIYNLIQQTTYWGHECQPSESVRTIMTLIERTYMEGRSTFDMQIPSTLGEDILQVLKDTHITKTLEMHYKMNQKWRIEDGTLNFLSENQIKRLFDDDVELTTTDIVHTRYPTTDAQDFRFSINDMNIQIHDMGGQPTELTKLPDFMRQWIADNRESYRNFLLLVTSMADFNIEDLNEPGRTAMDRSIRIVDRVLSEDTLQNCGVMIFFNKQDRFDSIVEILQETEEGRIEIDKYLGETLTEESREQLRKGCCSEKALHEAIHHKYDKVINMKRKGGKGVYMRCTQAVDPKIMNAIFKVIQNEIITYLIDNVNYIM
ncbi:g-protein alpha subunit, partial [Dictyocaulus viviparus]